jgi:kynureninase
MEPGVDLLAEVGVQRLRYKSMALTDYMIDLVDARLAEFGFRVGTPRQAEQRGSHVSIRHPEGYRINRALIEEMNVLPDFREPDNLRLGLAPIYTTYVEVWECVDRIAQVMEEDRYLKYDAARSAVT